MWYWTFGVLMTALFWGLIIWAVAYLWGLGRRRQGPAGQWHPSAGGSPWDDGPDPRGHGPVPWGGPGRGREADPEEILARRFAAGEIDEEEYHRRLDALRSRPAGGMDRRSSGVGGR